jgi:hypothetical protein
MLNRFSDRLLTSQLKRPGFSRGRNIKHDWFSPTAVWLQDREPRTLQCASVCGTFLTCLRIAIWELAY